MSTPAAEPSALVQGNHPVNLVLQRMVHHASASGYDRLADYMDAKILRAPEQLGIVERALGKLFKPVIRRSGLAWYHREAFVTELAVARRWLGCRGQVFHFLYGENQFRYAGILRRLRGENLIVATYHTPEGRFREVVKDASFLETLDAAIVMSSVQKAFLARHLPQERIHVVPHGIDTHFFSPAPRAEKTSGEAFRCIAVGSHLRDHATLAQVARLLQDSDPGIRIDVVTRPDLFFHYEGLSNVDLASGITDETLVDLYQRADLLLLPLIDATANNSLLEAMACGLAVVSTDLPGLRDYVDASCAELAAPGDAPGLARIVRDLRADAARLGAMSRASRRKAESLAWKNIALQTLSVYESAWTMRSKAQ